MRGHAVEMMRSLVSDCCVNAPCPSHPPTMPSSPRPIRSTASLCPCPTIPCPCLAPLSPPQAYEIDSIPLPMGHHEAAHLAKHRQAIIIVNPHKIRMSPLLAWHEVGEREAQHAGIVEGWKRCVWGGRRGA